MQSKAEFGVIWCHVLRRQKQMPHVRLAGLNQFNREPDTAGVGCTIEAIPMRKNAGDEAFVDFIVFFGARDFDGERIINANGVGHIAGMWRKVALKTP